MATTHNDMNKKIADILKDNEDFKAVFNYDFKCLDVFNRGVYGKLAGRFTINAYITLTAEYSGFSGLDDAEIIQEPQKFAEYLIYNTFLGMCFDTLIYKYFSKDIDIKGYKFVVTPESHPRFMTDTIAGYLSKNGTEKVRFYIESSEFDDTTYPHQYGSLQNYLKYVKLRAGMDFSQTVGDFELNGDLSKLKLLVEQMIDNYKE